MIKLALGIDTGTLSGKQNVRDYWAAALHKIPDLNFELKEVTTSVNSIALFYKSVMGKWLLKSCFLMTWVKSIRLQLIIQIKELVNNALNISLR